MGFLEVFEDRKRLGNDLAVDLERRHQALGISGAVGGAVLFAVLTPQVHGQRVDPNALDVERDAHAISRAAPKIGVKLHGITSSMSNAPPGLVDYRQRFLRSTPIDKGAS